jgi:hypothetical protein
MLRAVERLRDDGEVMKDDEGPCSSGAQSTACDGSEGSAVVTARNKMQGSPEAIAISTMIFLDSRLGPGFSLLRFVFVAPHTAPHTLHTRLLRRPHSRPFVQLV